MILCDDEDDDDEDVDDDDDGEEEKDDFLATYHPLFWAQPPQLALVIHLLHQDIFVPRYFCTNIYLHQHVFASRFFAPRYISVSKFKFTHMTTMLSIWCYWSTWIFLLFWGSPKKSIHGNFLPTLYSQAPISANISDNLSNWVLRMSSVHLMFDWAIPDPND